MDKGVWRCCGGGGGAEILDCEFGGLWKIGKDKGKDVKSGLTTKGFITWARLDRFAEISA